MRSRWAALGLVAFVLASCGDEPGLSTIIAGGGGHGPPVLELSTDNLDFVTPVSGDEPAAQVVSVANAGEGALEWSASADAAWVELLPASGRVTEGSDSVSVRLTTAALDPGDYQAVLTFSAKEAQNSPATVTVNLTVLERAGMWVMPAALSFEATQDAPGPDGQSFTLGNDGERALYWSADESETWLSVDPASGTLGPGEQVEISVAVDTTGVVAGTYETDITLTAPDCPVSTMTVHVTLVVYPPATIGLSPATFSFSGVEGGANPPTQVLDVTNAGGGTLDWTASEDADWLFLAPTSGSTAATETTPVNLLVDIAGLGPGTHTATITVTAPGATNDPQTVPVTLDVDAQPVIELSHATLYVTAGVGQLLPDAGDFQVWNSGGGMLVWSASEDAGWLTLEQVNGVSTGEPNTVSITVDGTGLVSGAHTATVTFDSPNAANAPTTMTVHLTLGDLARSDWAKVRADAGNTGCSQGAGPRSPSVAWSVAFPDMGGDEEWRCTSAPAVGPDGTVYFLIFHHIRDPVTFFERSEVVFLAAQGGREKWRFVLWSEEGHWWEDRFLGSPAVAYDGTVYVGNFNAGLFAISPEGSLLWQAGGMGGQWDFNMPSRIAVTREGLVVQCSEWEARFYSPEGYEVWGAGPPSVSRNCVAIGPDGSIVGASGNNVDACRWNSQNQMMEGLWCPETPLAGNVDGSSPAIGPDGTVYVGADDGYLYAIDASEWWGLDPMNPPDPWPADPTVTQLAGPFGQIRWSPAIRPDGAIYIVSDDNYVRAIDPDGTELWSYSFIAYGSPWAAPVCDQSGRVYIRCGDRLVGLDADGNELWDPWQTNFWANDQTELAIVDGALLVVGRFPGPGWDMVGLAAVGTGGGGGALAASPWPKAFADAGNTSRSSRGAPASLPEERWRYEPRDRDGNPMNPGAMGLTVGPDGTTYVVFHDPFGPALHAVDSTGERRWKRILDSWGTPAIGSDGTIYLPEPLAAVSAQGSLLWSTWAGGPPEPRIALGGGLLFLSDQARDPATGGRFWFVGEIPPSVPDGYRVDGTPNPPAIAGDGTVYGFEGSLVVAFEPAPQAADCNVLWRSTVEADAPTMALASDGTIYCWNWSTNTLGAVNPDGSEKWTFPVGEWIDGQGKCLAVASDDTVVFQTDQALWAVWPDGTQRWRLDGLQSEWTPTLDAGDRIYAGSGSSVRCLSIADGSETWSYDLAGEWVQNQPIVGPDNSLLVLTDFALVCLGGEGGAAEINVSPKSLAFSGTVGAEIDPKTVRIANASEGGLDWSASPMNPWLTLDPESGTLPPYDNQDVTVTVRANQWLPMNSGDAPSARGDHTAVWTGAEMIVWGGSDGGPFVNTGARYDPAADSWTPTSTDGAPSARILHTAVWTGTEMIVWGGDDGGYTNTGARYDPVTDTWTSTSTEGAPSARYFHATVWTGTEMIVWGGYDAGGFTNTGARYDPAADAWTATTPTAAPSARGEHTAVWTGTEMIVWGGFGLDTGGRYDPVTDTWTPTTTDGAPSGRNGHTAAWTGAEMVVWGGMGPGWENTGGRYSPVTDKWMQTSTSGAPAGRVYHTAVWTGREMIVWGGDGGAPQLNTGGVYDPAANSWTPTSLVAAPEGRTMHSAVWTGMDMIVWGGNGQTGVLNTGGRFRRSPASGSYATQIIFTAPLAVNSPQTVDVALDVAKADVSVSPTSVALAGTVGAEIQTKTVTLTNASDGAVGWSAMPSDVWLRLDPVAGMLGPLGSRDVTVGVRRDRWQPTDSVTAPSSRSYYTAMWTGAEMIVWGGYDAGGQANTGGRYDPATDTWTPTNLFDAPSARGEHTAVWTGSEMIVWGGYDGAYTQTGGRYDPVTDTWTPTSVDGAPSGRYEHTAVWTGSAMIVWGGSGTNTGGRYYPAVDAWIPTSTGGPPSGREMHSAVWTGTEMIVWGGYDPTYAETGGRYDPAADTWTPTDAAGAPSGRGAHAVIWNGSEMIIWGGDTAGGPTNTGARYDPGADSWAPTSTLGAPSARALHTAVWTSTEMIVWGGWVGAVPRWFSSGRCYDPASDTWRSMSVAGAPAGRMDHTAVWTGAEMIIWGGSTLAAPTNTGGRYRREFVPGSYSSQITFTIPHAVTSPQTVDVTLDVDVTAPVFGGATGASPNSQTEISASWNAAIDDMTAQENIVYNIYVAIASAGQDFGTATATSAPGATSHTVSGLAAGTPYYIVVRAQDLAGNEDANAVEVTATTLP